MNHTDAPGGGHFIVGSPDPEAIFTPEQLSAEARMIARSAEEFLRAEVAPVSARLEAHEPGLMPALLHKAGAMGLLGAGLPEAYGGFNLPKSTMTALIEKMALDLSFAISAGVHSGVATLPLLYFGTDEQKQRYLPKLASGEMLGAFALSEAGSGSDALNARTKATLTPDGRHYVLNGAKMWITNADFADLFTVFAKVDGEKFTAFLVERNTPGLHIDREEHKLGLKGSSTCRIALENAIVPIKNVLGVVGEGHRPALYILNIGRFNIGVTALGAAKEQLRTAVQYAKQRVQFGLPIAEFGLIEQKLGEMALRLFLLESMIYRVAGYWDIRFGAIDPVAQNCADAYRAATEEYSIECAIIKFYGTETLDYVVDEALQIHGGNGYSEEYPIARAYRDARVFRIFEGTNEINRLTVTDQIMRRIQRGRLNLPLEPHRIEWLDKSLVDNVVILSEMFHVRNELQTTLQMAEPALQQSLVEYQEVAGAIAEMTAALFAIDSALLRYLDSGLRMGSPLQELAYTAIRLAASQAMEQTTYLRRCVAAFLDMAAIQSLASGDTAVRYSVNPFLLRRHLARQVVALERYPWQY